MAQPSRDERHKLVGASDFYYAGIARMERFESVAASDPEARMRYGDGVMMVVSVCKSVRLKNLLEMVVGVNLVKEAGGNYVVRYGRMDVKTKKFDIEAALPATLTPFIEHWLDGLRPCAPSGGSSRRMWLTADGADMPRYMFYERFCRATKEELSVRINPHFVRKIIATSVTVSAPNLVEITQHLLDHTSDRLRKECYDLANKLSISAHYNELLESRRRQALDKLHEEES